MKILQLADFLFHRKKFLFPGQALIPAEISLSSHSSDWSADTNVLAQGKTQPVRGGRAASLPWINVPPGVIPPGEERWMDGQADGWMMDGWIM